MNDTLEYIGEKFDLNLHQRRMPIYIRAINRKIMAETLNELQLTEGAEIGVAQGNHARLLCENIIGHHLYCIDPWRPYEGYNEYVDRIEEYYQKAMITLRGFNCSYMREFSMDAVKKFRDNSLDFVYIDGAHDFKNIAMDLCEWTKKVRVGGIVFGHDYKRRYHKYVVQVKSVVQAYMYDHAIKPWFVLGERTNRSDGMYKEGSQSWMFVRQDTDRLRT